MKRFSPNPCPSRDPRRTRPRRSLRSDYAGKSQVLNIVLSAESGIDGNVTASGNRRYTGYVNTDLSGSAVIRRGPSTFNLSAGTGRNKQLEEGTDTLVDLGTGQQVEFRRSQQSSTVIPSSLAAVSRTLLCNAYRLRRWHRAGSLHQDKSRHASNGPSTTTSDPHPQSSLESAATSLVRCGEPSVRRPRDPQNRDDSETYLFATA